MATDVMQFSVENTMSFNNSDHSVQNFLLGHILMLQSEKQTCDKNLTKIKDPLDGTSDVSIIAPISQWEWPDHLAKNSIEMHGVSEQQNNGKLQLATKLQNSSVHWKFQFTIFRYDVIAKKWIEYYKAEEPLEATLTPGGRRVASPNPVPGFENPKLFPFAFTFSPAKVQKIIFQPSDGVKEVLIWGTDG